jgi:hypothetical protein
MLHFKMLTDFREININARPIQLIITSYFVTSYGTINNMAAGRTYFVQRASQHHLKKGSEMMHGCSNTVYPRQTYNIVDFKTT